MKVRHFRSSAEFHRWLEANHARATELWVGFYRKEAGRTGMTYPEAVDEALCFGWIDGVRKKVDELSYTNRFSPRSARSIWSAINLKRIEVLRAEGRVTPAGLKALESRDPKRSGLYSFENRPKALGPEYERLFKANPGAWRFFCAQPPSYQRVAIWWVLSAAKEDTRQRRLATLIECSRAGRRIGQVPS
jgi:uncharacterized protein YdeI (YjbR/CyaY-like superfamily)